MSQLIAEVFDAIFTISLTYSKLNIEYEYEISSSSVKIYAVGQNSLIIGEMKHPDASKEAKEKIIEKFKCKGENSWKTHAERMAQKKVN